MEEQPGPTAAQAVVFPDAEPAGAKGEDETPQTSSVAEDSEVSATTKVEPVSYWRLWTLADKWDVMAILAGVLGSLANAPIFPLFALIFGDVRLRTRAALLLMRVFLRVHSSSGSKQSLQATNIKLHHSARM